jgi:hypothetical protein
MIQYGGTFNGKRGDLDMNVQIIPATAADAEALVVIQRQAFKRLYDIYRDDGSPYLRGAEKY